MAVAAPDGEPGASVAGLVRPVKSPTGGDEARRDLEIRDDPGGAGQARDHADARAGAPGRAGYFLASLLRFT